ncbi:MAG TPA: hypothetical protein VFO01_00875 [Trebonia sp.]|nr:hypothetical protein [Trebonia sp.]
MAAWVVGGLALTALFVRISLSARVMSDGGSIALQAWDLLHGHLRLHGWQVSDLNCYFLEVPVIALAEAIFGLGDFAQHVASSLVYMLVAFAALAAAVMGSRGAARVVRGGVVLAVLAAPLFGGTGYLELEEPDHIGTSVFIIGAFILIDRYIGRRFTTLLLLVLLTAAQFDDLTVRYVAVPAIVLVCASRALAARSFRSPDAMAGYAALASVPLSAMFSWFWVRIGGFITPPLWQGLTPAGTWIHHVRFVWESILSLYGAGSVAGIAVGWRAYFGFACLFAATAGLVRVVVRWRRASRTEQMMVIAIVCNLGAFLVSGFSTVNNPHELALLLPCGAVLAARTLVPARIRAAVTSYVAVAAAALLAALPLAYAASRPNFQPPKAPLAAFLEAHHLTRGISGYDEAATVRVLTHGQIHLSPVHVGYDTLAPYTFESNSLWYLPSEHTATFAVADPKLKTKPSVFLHYFGKPVAIYKVDEWTILVYDKNLLRLLSRS